MPTSKRGQSLVEFCVLLQIFVITLALMMLVSLKALLPFLLQVDLYDLARAHLYENDTDQCEASSLWPRHFIEVNLQCLEIPKHYEAKAFLIWNDERLLISKQSYGLGIGTP